MGFWTGFGDFIYRKWLICCLPGRTVLSQELDSMILVGPFQPRILCDFMIL